MFVIVPVINIRGGLSHPWITSSNSHSVKDEHLGAELRYGLRQQSTLYLFYAWFFFFVSLIKYIFVYCFVCVVNI